MTSTLMEMDVNSSSPYGGLAGINSSTVSPPAETNNVPVPLRTVLMLTIITGIVFSNLLNLAVLRLTDQIPGISRMCLLNLSTADLLVGVVSCAPCIYPAITGVWPYGDVWCQIAGITHGVSVTMSIWSLAFVSVDRYLAILKPLRYNVLITPARCRAFLAFLWMIAFLTFFMPLPTMPNFIYYQYSPAELMCGLYWGYPWFCVVTAIYIPVLAGTILVYTTVRIARTVVAMQTNVAPVPNSGVDSGGNVHKVSGKDLKAVKVLVITAGMYFLAWGPYVVEVVVISFVPWLPVPGLVRFITIWLANCNSFMNVIIYSVMYRGFRKNCVWVFSVALAKVLCREPPERPRPQAEHTGTRSTTGQ